MSTFEIASSYTAVDTTEQVDETVEELHAATATSADAEDGQPSGGEASPESEETTETGEAPADESINDYIIVDEAAGLPDAPDRWTASGKYEMKTARVALDRYRESELAHEVAEVLRTLSDKDAEKKSFDRLIGAEIKDLQAKAFRLGRSIEEGAEETSIRCAVFYDYANSRVQLRKEYSDEVFEERAMTDSERQMKLAIDEDRHPDDQEGQPEQLSLLDEDQPEEQPQQQYRGWAGKCNGCGWTWEDPFKVDKCPSCASTAISLEHLLAEPEPADEVANNPDNIPGDEEEAIASESEVPTEEPGIISAEPAIRLHPGLRGSYNGVTGTIIALRHHSADDVAITSLVQFQLDKVGRKQPKSFEVERENFLEGFTPEVAVAAGGESDG